MQDLKTINEMSRYENDGLVVKWALVNTNLQTMNWRSRFYVLLEASLKFRPVIFIR